MRVPKFSAGKTTGTRDYTGVIRAFEPGLIRVGDAYFFLTGQLERNVLAHRHVGDRVNVEYAVDTLIAKAIVLVAEARGLAYIQRAKSASFKRESEVLREAKEESH